MTSKEIPNYPGYFATDDGKIWSEHYKSGYRGGQNLGCFLQPIVSQKGYLRVLLYRPDGRKARLVHDVVLETFVGPRPIGMVCCHDNGMRTDNRVENLRWDTPSANYLDSVRHCTFKLNGTHSRPGELHPMHKLTQSQVRWIRYLFTAGISFKHLSEGFEVSKACVVDIVNRRNWKHAA